MKRNLIRIRRLKEPSSCPLIWTCFEPHWPLFKAGQTYLLAFKLMGNGSFYLTVQFSSFEWNLSNSTWIFFERSWFSSMNFFPFMFKRNPQKGEYLQLYYKSNRTQARSLSILFRPSICHWCFAVLGGFSWWGMRTATKCLISYLAWETQISFMSLQSTINTLQSKQRNVVSWKTMM